MITTADIQAQLAEQLSPPELERLRDASIALAESFLGAPLVATSHTETIASPGTLRVLLLAHRYVHSVSSVEYAPRIDGTYSAVLVPYVVDGGAGLLIADRPWPQGYIRVDYAAGIVQPGQTHPGLKATLLELALWLRRRNGADASWADVPQHLRAALRRHACE